MDAARDHRLERWRKVNSRLPNFRHSGTFVTYMTSQGRGHDAEHLFLTDNFHLSLISGAKIPTQATELRFLGFDNVVQDQELQSLVAAVLEALPPGVPRLLWLRAGDGVDNHRGDLNPLETYITDLCERRFEMHNIPSLNNEQWSEVEALVDKTYCHVTVYKGRETVLVFDPIAEVA
jgi:hypothetical protein